MKLRQKVYLPFKYLIDFLGSLTGIVFCFCLLWWWVFPVNLIITKGHPFFNLCRVGKNGKKFPCFKFRTMKIDSSPYQSSREKNGDELINNFSKFLRTFSIDETLQLFNILLGQMSFVGPRPLIQECADVVTIDLRKKNGSEGIRPGITGYAQLCNRGNLDPVKKAEMDFIYFKNFSFLFDCKIFLSTIFKIFSVQRGK